MFIFFNHIFNIITEVLPTETMESLMHDSFSYVSIDIISIVGCCNCTTVS